jgi:hypothetical protein
MLAAQKNSQPSGNGKLIRPIIEITGYPAALKENAQLTPALPPAETKPRGGALRSSATGCNPARSSVRRWLTNSADHYPLEVGLLRNAT